MTARLPYALLYAWLLVCAAAISAAYGQTARDHNDYHPRWLQKTGCCDPSDTRKVRVRFVPPNNWMIVWVDNPPGLPVLSLRRPIVVSADKVRRSQDRNWWAAFHYDAAGNITSVRVIHNKSDGARPCVFGQGGGG